MVKTLGVLVIFLLSKFCFAAAELPSSMTVNGQLFNSASGTDPLLDSSITLTLDILNPAKDCILYQETQLINTTGSNGYFNIQVGSPTTGGTSANRTGNDAGNSMASIYQNASAIPGRLVSTGAACTYTPTANDLRYLRVHVSPSSTGVTSILSPDMALNSVPSALVAEALSGIPSAGILQSDISTSLNQTNLSSVFSNSNYPKLLSLLDGTSNQYVDVSAGSGAGLPTYTTASPPSAPVAGSIWFDNTSHTIKLFDGSSTQDLGLSGGSNPIGAAGGDLSGSYPNPAVGTVGGSTASLIHDAELLANSATNSNTYSMIVKRDASGNFAASQASFSSILLRDTGSNTATVRSPASYTSSYTLTMPSNVPVSNGQVLSSTTAGIMSWATIPTALPPNGSAGGDLGGSFPSPTVAQIQGTAVDAAAPTASGQLLRYNGTSKYIAGFLGVADIRSTLAGAAQFFPTTCTAAQTLVWNAPTDTMVCTDISVAPTNFASQTANTVLAAPNGSGGSPTFRTLASADLPAGGYDTAYFKQGGSSFGATAELGTADNNILNVKTNNVSRVTINTSGNVGIGTTSPDTRLHVVGTSGTTLKIVDGNQGIGKVLTSDANGVASWTGGNVDITAASYTITSAQSGYHFTFNGVSAGTINLPALSAVNDGFHVVIIRQVAQSLTLAPDGTDTFPNGTTTFEMRGQNLASVTLTKYGSTWNVTSKTDDCIIGQACWGTGNIYFGVLNGHQYFTTPGGCTDSATPTCADGADTVTKLWANNSGTTAYNVNAVAVDDPLYGATQSDALATSFTDTDAAKFCESMNYAGNADWYLPAKQELSLLYNNSAFLRGFVYQAGIYFSSTENSTTLAWTFSFQQGYYAAVNKNLAYYVRCIRRL